MRGSPPNTKISSAELSEYCRNFESKMSAFLQPIATLSTEEFEKLGAKNAEAYPFFCFNEYINARYTNLTNDN